jgi:hypothetical protein
MGWVANAYDIFFGKPEGRRQFGRSIMQLNNILGYVDWILQANDTD